MKAVSREIANGDAALFNRLMVQARTELLPAGI